jgi:hypothetical protein
MARFQAVGYEEFRNSENKIFTHGVAFYNNAQDCVGVEFHVSLKLAQTNALTINKRSHIDVLEIVEVVKVGA